MSILQTVQRMEDVLHEIDQWINRLYEEDADYSYLLVTKEALTSQIVSARQTIAYKMELYDLYGEPMDDVGVEELRVLIQEIGYDQVQALFGESINAVLNEAAAEEASYSG